MDMLEQKQDFLSEPAGPEWERAWASMQNRTIPDPSSLDLPLDENFGQAISATISEAPIQYLDYLYLPTDHCPLCSASTTDTQRIPVSLTIHFDQIKGKIGFSAWVHRECFEKLQLSDDPPPIPW
jgi:hypothetical protein